MCIRGVAVAMLLVVDIVFCSDCFFFSVRRRDCNTVFMKHVDVCGFTWLICGHQTEVPTCIIILFMIR